MLGRVHRYKVLLVDDSSGMLKVIKTLLKEIGFQHIDTAANGKEALQKLGEAAYDLILSDWSMSPMTGIELLKVVRHTEGLQYIPFIMMSSESLESDILAAKEAGVSAYIIKPFNVITLRSKILAVLGEL